MMSSHSTLVSSQNNLILLSQVLFFGSGLSRLRFLLHDSIWTLLRELCCWDALDMSDTTPRGSSLTVVIPFPDARLATIAYRTLSVDKEPIRGGVNKTLSVDGNELKAVFVATDVKNLRTAANKFLDYAKLTIETIQMFG